jgi:FMN phosphatase YigB (HAD superfamily)
MPASYHIFFDFDDTLSDLEELRRQYVRELSLILSSKYGTGEQAWREALAPALDASIHRYVVAHAGNPEGGYAHWISEERGRVTDELFRSVGVPLPAHESLPRLALDIQAAALRKCNASYSDTAETIRFLVESGHEISMGSSQESGFLRPALEGSGMSNSFNHFFGADLVDMPKEGPEFYQRIFAAVGIRPSQAIVVDDQAMCLDWAEEAGAKVIQACIRSGAPEPEFPHVIRTLGELPALLRHLYGPP